MASLGRPHPVILAGKSIRTARFHPTQASSGGPSSSRAPTGSGLRSGLHPSPPGHSGDARPSLTDILLPEACPEWPPGSPHYPTPPHSAVELRPRQAGGPALSGERAGEGAGKSPTPGEAQRRGQQGASVGLRAAIWADGLLGAPSPSPQTPRPLPCSCSPASSVHAFWVLLASVSLLGEAARSPQGHSYWDDMAPAPSVSELQDGKAPVTEILAETPLRAPGSLWVFPETGPEAPIP